MKKAVIAYVPVLHEGYRQFFEKHRDADMYYIFGSSLIEGFDYLHKEIRALAPEQMKQALEALGLGPSVSVLESTGVAGVSAAEVVLPDEDISRQFAETYLSDITVTFDPFFLRWDRTNTKKEKKVGAERVTTESELMNTAFRKAMESSDWWRQIGAVLVRDGAIIGERANTHLPSPHQVYADGDPRNASHKGRDLDKYTSIHAEAALIADAARKGVALEGAEMYVTDFPCPVCAKQIAVAGIKTLYFTRGYAVLDGERILKQSGVEIVEVRQTNS